MAHDSKLDSCPFLCRRRKDAALYICVQFVFKCLVTPFCLLQALFLKSSFKEALPVGLCVVLSVCFVSLFVCWSVCVYRVMCLQCVSCIVAAF